jgi:peptidoglycan/xylan/chitin deacetylase (PgdA/CDA1 family)
MLFAGIAWTAHGFELALLDARGTPVGARTRFPAGQVAQLIDHLRALAATTGEPVVCVIDSTNGMIDGGLMSAGLRVHRADPWLLPERTVLGSADAEELARAGVTRLPELSRLDIESGTLTGRADEHARHLRDSTERTDALTVAGRCLARSDRDEGDKVLALTFDDGPNPPWTGRILDVLESYDVPATFFCVGLHASAHTEEVARMAEAGHQVGNHTWSHPFLPDLSRPELAEQLERTDEALARSAALPERRLFRPPYGSRTPEVLSWLETGHDHTVVLWDLDTRDWSMPGADAISRTVLEQARPGSIALFHDGGGDRSQTAEALPSVIEGLLERGYRFALVEELLP